MKTIETIKTTLERDGYIILRSALKFDSVNSLARSVKNIFAAHSQPGEDIYKTCVRLGNEDKELLYRIYQYSHSNIVMDHLRQECFQYAKPLYPEDGIFIDIDSHVIINLPTDERISWGWHQESTYHPDIENSFGFWFPFLEPSTIHNGTMSVLKGSHQLGRLPYTTHKPSSHAATTLVPENIEKLQREYNEEHCLLNPCDLLMFDMNLVHRSNLNKSNHPRFTGLFRVACIDRIPERFGKIT